ncbi:DUF4845 domain-containing protein [Noviherbaspirillum sp. UKPF54]|uniref:DUF4845 domain-containing protein n=1 Tax=Noviherbaspirillum sp. UKPF54 TaxID=2601898 RepID=UPI0011B184CC|nr:DUF4845 domain-containing protein [Noviherbaspirillum sp. UKPF54]QDZ27519.1 DUF4845 domain-containing protein [Noviherbaspirillum sp. UKPF54]
MKLRSATQDGQEGLSLVGFMFVTAIIAVLVVLGMKVVPTVIEYTAIKKAITTATANAASARDIQVAFDKQRDAGYIESVSGKDLEITKTADGFDVSVSYEKRIGLIGPTSLVIDYVASTGGKPAQKIAQ